MANKRYGMVIDLHNCVGCAACDLACKAENNTPDGFAWSNHILESSGTFPNVRLRYIPTLCNHCEDAPCVLNCPTTAMYKSDDGMTLHDPDKCIGCRSCQVACPYDVIYYNEETPFKGLRKDTEPAIAGCTSTAAEINARANTPIPHYNPARAETYDGVRRKGIVEKCTFCDHRVAHGELPACVEACPADARIFGDLNDPDSEPSRKLAKFSPKVLKKEKGTRPAVYYIRDFAERRS